MLHSDINSVKRNMRVMFGNMGNMFNIMIASWEDRFVKDLILTYRMMDHLVGGVEKNIVEYGSNIKHEFTRMTAQMMMRLG
ncbi:hypothetical protein Syun_001194 [Stephania yunnanensis]|uniref:Uncharacterized protein n=1 Tax=Stephania yunnanensis TaxID=152371 RepID=A0AAP0LIX3_9MAGN